MSENPFSVFPPEVQKDVEGLMWLGYLEDSFSFCGHRITLRTLKGEDDLIAGLLAKHYEGTLAQAKAWAWANVTMAVVSIDGEPNFCPAIGPDPEDHARGKFAYLIGAWYWPTCEYVYEKLGLLVRRQRDAIAAVQDLSDRSLRPSTPSRDFLTGPGDSSESIVTDDPS